MKAVGMVACTEKSLTQGNRREQCNAMPMQMNMQFVHCDTLTMLLTTRQSTRR
jgi:hypothetical protein